MKHFLTALLAIAVAVVGPGATTAASAATGERVSKPLYRAIRDLPVVPETPRGYDRDKFRHWVDADGDCQDTRDEVLAAESLVKVSGCDIQDGSWLSYYDGVLTSSSSEFDIDHLVPLAEAWRSGAKRWTARTRQRFANDLGDPRSLVAVDASANRSKSDSDPSDWMPDLEHCRYVRQWVAVKIRWSLKVNRAEKRALRSYAANCKNVTVTVTRAVVRIASGSTTGGSGSGGGGGGLDPRFDYCYEAKAAGYGPYYRGRDPEYAWYTDGDSDGIVCE